MPDTALVPLEKLDPAEAWKPWQPTSMQPWNRRWAGHLYRRAGFGATLTDLHESVRRGLPETLDRLFQGELVEGRDEFLASMGANVGRGGDPEEMQGWWLYAMLYNPHALREKMTLFWHGHFATSIVKVTNGRAMFRQNELLRKHALGKFRPFLLDISRDPAMLIWLDSNNNVKGKANENYARELMELFSLGVGNYTEKDIQEAARAFTGWHTDGDRFTFNPNFHDGGPKSFLGQKGNWDGGDVVRIVLEQPAAARFIARKLYRYFVSETADPPDALLEPLADAFRKSDYDIALIVQTMLRSRHFFSAHAYRQRVKSPVEFTLGAVRALAQASDGNYQVSPRALANQLEAMGQQLFAPPNVKGWEAGRSWLSTATVLARHNFAQALVQGSLGNPTTGGRSSGPVDVPGIVRREKIQGPNSTVAFLADLLLQGDLPGKARAKLIAFMGEGKSPRAGDGQRIREVAHALLTMPEYQLA